MHSWYQAVQAMIDWIEEHLEHGPSLLPMSRDVGYSPYYCSYLFHQITGRTLRRYVADRRLSSAALALRDTSERILDISVRFGFSSQEALTRAFLKAYGCTPYAYRIAPGPIKLVPRKVVLFPDSIASGGMDMSGVQEANIFFEHFPAHKYLGIREPRARHYGEFWEYHDCDEMCGVIESMRHAAHEIVGCHTAGWYREGGERRYFYGLGVPTDYDGPVPEGFSVYDVPESLYLVFFHPPFAYPVENSEVMSRVEHLAWNYVPGQSDRWWIPGNYEWNEDICPAYQRHFPEVLGYQVLRPVRRKA